MEVAGVFDYNKDDYKQTIKSKPSTYIAIVFDPQGAFKYIILKLL